MCGLLAPVYAHYVAHTGPNDAHLGDQVSAGGRLVPVVSVGGTRIVNGQTVLTPGGVPIGPQWFAAGGRFVLGADALGRDVAVRILYGLRISLLIGLLSAGICTGLAIMIALMAAFYRGWIDWLVVRVLDVVWAFPVILLAVGVATALALSGFHHFGINIQSGSLVIPIGIISLSFVPYLARPLRGELLSLRERDFIDAALAQGAGPVRIMAREMFPNVLSTVLVLFTLTVANMIIFEAALSFLGAGVQPPNPSLGVLINDGAQTIVTAPWLAAAPGVVLTLVVLSLNLLGEGLRQALDIRARVRVGR
jgi:peptide/nickel transport system permease protein